MVRASKIFPIAKPPKMSVSQIRRAVQKFEVAPDVSDSKEEELPAENTIKEPRTMLVMVHLVKDGKRQRVNRRDGTTHLSHL